MFKKKKDRTATAKMPIGIMYVSRLPPSAFAVEDCAVVLVFFVVVVVDMVDGFVAVFALP